MKYKVAIAQIDSGAERDLNFKKIENAVRDAAAQHADLIIFPETVDYIGTDFPGHATPVPGIVTSFFASLAQTYQIYIHCGSITEKTSGKPKNTSFLFDKTGKRLDSYSKLHMFDIAITDGPSYKESDDICPGDKITIFDTPFGRLGTSICYDLRFPELYRSMARQGAGILIVAANFTHNTGLAHWETLLRARAIENTCYVIAADQTGEKAAFAAHGHSMVIDPWGTIIAQAGMEETILYAQIDTEQIQKIRAQMPSLQNIRDDVY